MNSLVFGKYWLAGKLRDRQIAGEGVLNYSRHVKKYADRDVLDANEINAYIANLIESKEPFMAARFGSTELLNIRAYDFPVRGKYSLGFHFNHLCEWSGFFPNDRNLLESFVSIMKNSAKEIDVFAIWFHGFEDYYIRKLMKRDIKCTYLLNFEPWMGEVHWSAALKGKKVLVIHPFENTIKEQYKKRELIFPGTDILPEFELKTLKAVQTIANVKDERFNTWFEALDWMYNEAMRIDFDIAIIGCGAYGMPLAAKLKTAGKQAIHLAGATQLLFGIKGSRWESDEVFSYVARYFNDNWVYPDETDRPKDADKVESACYWK